MKRYEAMALSVKAHDAVEKARIRSMPGSGYGLKGIRAAWEKARKTVCDAEQAWHDMTIGEFTP